MTLIAYLKIQKDQLSNTKKNVIPYSVGNKVCGQVKKIVQEVQPGIYMCEIMVYPQCEDYVLNAVCKEADSLKGK